MLILDKILSYEIRVRSKMIVLVPILMSCMLKNSDSNLNLHFLKFEEVKLRVINTV